MSATLPTFPDETTYELGLPDGRTLSFTEHGAPHGTPVVVTDGPGSRGLARAASRAADELGIRLIAPDRPGFFGSTRAADKTFGGVARDIVALADHLGLERFGLLAQSGGTPFALAVAAQAGDRVTGLSFCGAISPFGEPGALDGVEAPMRPAFVLAVRAPWLLRPLMRLAARQIAKDPAAAARTFAEGAPARDRAVLDDPAMWAIHEQSTNEARLAGAPAGFGQEVRMMPGPWGIDLAAITAPAAFWVGDHDVTHPVAMSRRMAERLGGAPVHVVPDAATFGLVDRYPDALVFAARA